MDLLISFGVFIIAMLACLLTGHTMVIALLVGLAAFVITGIRRGFAFRQLAKMGVGGAKDAIDVIAVMMVIGFITAIWRASGTIAFFVFYGMKIITPGVFLIITYLLCTLLSYALGTSFGVAGTAGVIFMSLARAGGVNPLITAGVIMSGVYFGDRCSPVASSALLVAGITKTDILTNVKYMLKTSVLPFGITLIAYTVLSFRNPLTDVDQSFMNKISAEFNISWWCLVPALFMLILPLLKIKVINAMFVSIASGVIISIALQGMDISALVKAMIFGYQSEGRLADIINGGGFLSMIEVVFIVSISCAFSGIFDGTNMLETIQDKLSMMITKIGHFASSVIVSFVMLAVFCNQTIASMMCNDMLKKPYADTGAGKQELCIDLENSVIILAPVVPWTIACTVPLSFMQVGTEALIYAFYLFLLPICYALTKKFFMKDFDRDFSENFTNS